MGAAASTRPTDLKEEGAVSIGGRRLGKGSSDGPCLGAVTSSVITEPAFLCSTLLAIPLGGGDGDRVGGDGGGATIRMRLVSPMED